MRVVSLCWFLLTGWMVVLSACSTDRGGTQGAADGGADAARMDGATRDSTVADATVIDAFAEDAHASDSGAEDGSQRDAASSDGGAMDSGLFDGGPTDGGTSDSGSGADCRTNSDCADGFCRDKMDGGRECVPFAEEGDFCGGLTPTWGVRRCDPALVCLSTSPLIADAPGICGLPASVSGILADPSAFDRRVVGITGWVKATGVGCTRIACSPAMPCCNSCSGGEGLFESSAAPSGIGLRNTLDVAYTCTGTECDPTETCTQTPDLEYRVIGFYVSSGNYLRVRSIHRTSF